MFSKQRLWSIFKQLVFREETDIDVGFSPSDFVGNMTQWYRANPDAFRSDILAAYKDLISLLDTNMDGYLGQNELVLWAQACGHNDSVVDAELFEVYGEPNGIPLHEAVATWFQFRTNMEEVENDGKRNKALRDVAEL